MTIPLSTKILLMIGTVGAAVYVIKRYQKPKYKPRKPAAPTKSRDPSCLFKVFGEGQTVGQSELIMSDLHESLLTEEIRSQVVDLQPEFATVAYEQLLYLVAKEKKDILGDPDVRDESVRRALNLIAGACDWSEGLAPYTHGSSFQRVWTGVGTLGELAQANLIAKGILEG